MKIYELSELQKTAKEHGFNHIALIDTHDHKIVPFNKNNITIENQFKKIKKRFDSELCQDGEYIVLMAESIRATSNPNRFSIVKGNPKALPTKTEMSLTPAQEVLTWSSALQMTQDIAILRAENMFLKKENELLQKEIEEYELELQAAQMPGENGLLDQAKNGVSSFLNDNGPMLINIADKFFAMKDRELALQEKGITKGIQNTTVGKKNMVVGSEAHLNIIRAFFENEDEKQMNYHLDLLQAKDQLKHDRLVKELGLEVENEEEEEPELEEEEENENE